MLGANADHVAIVILVLHSHAGAVHALNFRAELTERNALVDLEGANVTIKMELEINALCTFKWINVRECDRLFGS